MSTEAPKPTMLPYDKALALTLGGAPQPGLCRVALDQALGRVLRQDIVADRDQPPFDRSAMDGFAVRSAEVKAGVSHPIVGVVAAGAFEASRRPLAGGTVVRIATGAPLPPGADAVVQIELAAIDDAIDPPRVTFQLDGCEPGRNVHRRASDASCGQIVLHAGTRLRPQHIGIAASVGAVELEVAAPLRVTLITTGDEVVAPHTATSALQPQQIRNSNGPMMRALLASLGVEVLALVHVKDEAQETLAATREALSHSHLVITVGGVSVGQRDLLPATWQMLGLRTLVHGVMIQPGKPVFVATPSHDDAPDNKLVIGLPGNPVSVLATAHLFVWPVINRAMGIANGALPWRPVTLAASVKPNARREIFRAAQMLDDGRVRVVAWHGSGDLVHTAAAQGWLRLPMQDEAINPGASLPFLPMLG